MFRLFTQIVCIFFVINKVSILHAILFKKNTESESALWHFVPVNFQYNINPFLNTGNTNAKVGNVDLSKEESKIFKSESGLCQGISSCYILNNSQKHIVNVRSFITGTKNNDTLFIEGNNNINNIDLKGGSNTVTFKSGVHLYNTPDTEQTIKNVNQINIENNTNIENLSIIYSNEGTYVYLLGGNPNSSNDIIFGSLIFNSSDSKKTSNILLSGQVDVLKTIQLSNTKESINFYGGHLLYSDSETVDSSSITVLSVENGITSLGGDKTINFGLFSQVIIKQGFFDLSSQSFKDKSSHTLLIFHPGSSVIGGEFILGKGDDRLDVRSDGTKASNLIYKVKVQGVNFGGGNNFLNIDPNSNFTVVKDLIFGSGNDRIFIGANSKVQVSGVDKDTNVIMGSGNDYVYIAPNTEVTASFNMGVQTERDTSYSSTKDKDKKVVSIFGTNKFVVDTSNKATNTINGSVFGSGSNDTFEVLGNGFLKMNSLGQSYSIKGFSNVNIHQSSIELLRSFLVSNSDLNLTIGVKSPQNYNPNMPRIRFGSSVAFTKNSLNLKFTGVSLYLPKVGDHRDIKIFKLGKDKDTNKKRFYKYKQIGLKSIIFNSAMYNLETKINDNSLNGSLTKCSTIKGAVSGVNNCVNSQGKNNTKKYIIKMAKFLDNLLAESNISNKYYNFLDTLAMSSQEELKNIISSITPVNNDVYFNITKQINNAFNNSIFNDKPYKVTKGDVTFWSNYTNNNTILNQTEDGLGGDANSRLLNLGLEFSLNQKIKAGLSLGVAKSKISSLHEAYKGTGNSNYYGVYSFINLNRKLRLKLSSSVMQNYMNLTKRSYVAASTAYFNPKLFQFNMNIGLDYKIIKHKYLILPYANLGYTSTYLQQYKEYGGIMEYNISSSRGAFANLAGGASLVKVTKFNKSLLVSSIRSDLSFKATTNTNTIAKIPDLGKQLTFKAHNYGVVTLQLDGNINYILNSFLSFTAGSYAAKGLSLTTYGFYGSVKIKLL